MKLLRQKLRYGSCGSGSATLGVGTWSNLVWEENILLVLDVLGEEGRHLVTKQGLVVPPQVTLYLKPIYLPILPVLNPLDAETSVVDPDPYPDQIRIQ